jgi:hypothetical protein
MEDFWGWAQRIGGVLLLVLLCLYIIRCIAIGDVVSLHLFLMYVEGLLKYIAG